MGQRPPNPLPEDETLHIETPVINMQDLEHIANSRTRVSNKGVKITPTMDTALIDEQRVAEEDEDALRSLEQIEKSLRGQMPG